VNPRDFCRQRTFHKALLLTYSFDPVFFEQIVLPDLWAGRTSDILVLGDGDQVRSAIEEAAGRLWHLGKRYVLGRATHTGSFHPKVMIRIGATEGAVMIGSGNLTSCGWGGHKELGSAWLFGPNHADSGAWLQPFLDEVASWCASDLEKDALRRMKDVPWLTLGSATSSLPAPFLYSGTGRSLASALAQRWAGRQFSEVRIFTGSTDEGGAFLRWAHRTFGIRRAVIALTPSQASFSLDKLADLPLELRLIPMPGTISLHAKFYFFDGPEGSAAVMGSPNCSASAWLIPPEQNGNIETALVYDTPKADDFRDLLEVFESPSLPPEDVLTQTTPAAQQAASGSNCPYELVGLRWDGPSHRMMSVIKPRPEPETTVTLLLDTRQIPMQAGSGHADSRWFCGISEGIDFAAAEFASIRLDRGHQHWLTDIRWAEQRRILEDLHSVAQALFSDSATFKDVGFGNPQPAPEEPETPAPPVDPASLVRSLAQAAEPHAMLGGAAGNLSLSGILRLLFDAERAAIDNNAAADDEKLDEGQAVPPTSTQEPKKKTSLDDAPENQKPVDTKLQSRLANQIDAFLKNLSNPDFAKSCSATQMIQAVCFPLAVALRGQSRGWVSAASAEQWGLALVSLLFRGRTTGSPGLLRAVQQRYADNGQASLFREVVGDGTLWLVLISTLGNSRWQGAGTFVDKALALREVFREAELISSAQASRLYGLLIQVRFEDARTFVSVVAPVISELLDCVEVHLRPLWEREALEQSKRSITYQAGDLLWRHSAGWAVCLVDTTGTENIEVRLRGERKKVKASFYANISDLAKRDKKLSGLLADLRVQLESPGGTLLHSR